MDGGWVAAQQRRKVYVSNLHASVSTESLTRAFEKYGEITEVHMLNRRGRGGRLSGFVTFSRPEAALSAVEGLQGWYHEGDTQKVTVRFADAKSVGERDESSRQPPYKLYVSNLPSDATPEYVQEVFGAYGEVTDCYMMFNKGRGGRRSCFVTYSRMSSAIDAISALAEMYFDDQRLTIKWAESTPPQGALLPQPTAPPIATINIAPPSPPTQPLLPCPTTDRACYNLLSMCAVNSIPASGVGGMPVGYVGTGAPVAFANQPLVLTAVQAVQPVYSPGVRFYVVNCR